MSQCTVEAKVLPSAPTILLVENFGRNAHVGVNAGFLLNTEAVVESYNYPKCEKCGEDKNMYGGCQHGQLAMPGICPDCNRYLLSCTRPGVLQCDDFKSALQA
jgi:hypothetical protein